MRILITAGLCGLALVGLAGCGRNAASSSAPASSAASAAAPAAPAPAAPASMPHRRDGLWEQKMTMEGMNMVQTSQVCIDQAFEEKMALGAQGPRSKCSVYSMDHQVNGDWTFNSTCNIGQGTASTKGVVHGDFNNGYTMQADTTISGAAMAQMNRETKMTIQGTWLGPCKPDQKPGDMIVNGMKFNMLDRMNAAGPEGGGGGN